ncbi:MAG: Fis family transcriptional regulator [Acidithiobacillus sp.]|nr:Fis family transcriptional regulator [Acidithiobacillus sp.]
MSNQNARTSLRDCVRQEVEQYLADLGDQPAVDLYQRVLEEAERAVLEKVMEHCQGQRGLAAQCLGINRNTLRKKLQHYGLDI